MYQSVLTSNPPTIDGVEKAYLRKLNAMADTILAKHRYGTGSGKIDRLTFIKIKYLLPALRLNTQNTKSLNNILSALNS